MKNKLLVEIYVPQIDEKYNLFIPLNKNVANVVILVLKSINEMEGINITASTLYNSDTGLSYPPDLIIRNSNIRNGFKLILM